VVAYIGLRVLLCSMAAVYGCKNLDGMLLHALVRRHGDTTSVRCLATGETFFLTCIESRWVGELNNCSVPTPGQIYRLYNTYLYFTNRVQIPNLYTESRSSVNRATENVETITVWA